MAEQTPPHGQAPRREAPQETAQRIHPQVIPAPARTASAPPTEHPSNSKKQQIWQPMVRQPQQLQAAMQMQQPTRSPQQPPQPSPQLQPMQPHPQAGMSPLQPQAQPQPQPQSPYVLNQMHPQMISGPAGGQLMMQQAMPMQAMPRGMMLPQQMMLPGRGYVMNGQQMAAPQMPMQIPVQAARGYYQPQWQYVHSQQAAQARQAAHGMQGAAHHMHMQAHGQPYQPHPMHGGPQQQAQGMPPPAYANPPQAKKQPANPGPTGTRRKKILTISDPTTGQAVDVKSKMAPKGPVAGREGAQQKESGTAAPSQAQDADKAMPAAVVEAKAPPNPEGTKEVAARKDGAPAEAAASDAKSAAPSMPKLETPQETAAQEPSVDSAPAAERTPVPEPALPVDVSAAGNAASEAPVAEAPVGEAPEEGVAKAEVPAPAEMQQPQEEERKSLVADVLMQNGERHIDEAVQNDDGAVYPVGVDARYDAKAPEVLPQVDKPALQASEKGSIPAPIPEEEEAEAVEEEQQQAAEPETAVAQAVPEPEVAQVKPEPEMDPVAEEPTSQPAAGQADRRADPETAPATAADDPESTQVEPPPDPETAPVEAPQDPESVELEAKQIRETAAADSNPELGEASVDGLGPSGAPEAQTASEAAGEARNADAGSNGVDASSSTPAETGGDSGKGVETPSSMQATAAETAGSAGSAGPRTAGSKPERRPLVYFNKRISFREKMDNMPKSKTPSPTRSAASKDCGSLGAPESSVRAPRDGPVRESLRAPAGEPLPREDNQGPEDWEDTPASTEASSPSDSYADEAILSGSRKLVYSIPTLLSFKDKNTRKPEGLDVPRVRRGMMPTRGLGSSGTKSKGTIGDQGMSRATSGNGSRRSGGGRSGGGGGASQWQRGQSVPEQKGGKDKKRGGGSHRQEQQSIAGTPLDPNVKVKPLVRGENRWKPTKAENPLEATRKHVQGILNKFTKEKFDTLSRQLMNIRITSLPMLKLVIELVFEKAVTEAYLVEMYGDLCSQLVEWSKQWSFLRVLKDEDNNCYGWSADNDTDTEVVGPFSSLRDCYDRLIASSEDESKRVTKRDSMRLVEMKIKGGNLYRCFEEDGSFFAVFESMESLLEQGIDMNARFATEAEALASAAKKCSFKFLILSLCQTEYEKIDEDHEVKRLEEDFAAKNFRGMSQAEIDSEREEFELKRTKIKRRMMGNILLIGELCKRDILREKIVRECIIGLLRMERIDEANGVYRFARREELNDEESYECVCKLLTSLGQNFEAAGGDSLMYLDFFFTQIQELSNDKRLSSRTRFMMKDLIELRQNRWIPRREEQKAMTLDEVRMAAERENRAKMKEQAGRNPSMRSDRRLGTSSAYTSGGRRVNAANSRSNPRDAPTSGRPGAAQQSRRPANDARRSPQPPVRAAPALSEEEIKKRVDSLVSDYTVTEDYAEAKVAVEELPLDKAAPILASFLLEKIVDCKQDLRPKYDALLTRLAAEGFLSARVLREVLPMHLEYLEDLRIDVPGLLDNVSPALARLMGLASPPISCAFLAQTLSGFETISHEFQLALFQKIFESMLTIPNASEVVHAEGFDLGTLLPDVNDQVKFVGGPPDLWTLFPSVKAKFYGLHLDKWSIAMLRQTVEDQVPVAERKKASFLQEFLCVLLSHDRCLDGGFLNAECVQWLLQGWDLPERQALLLGVQKKWRRDGRPLREASSTVDRLLNSQLVDLQGLKQWVEQQPAETRSEVQDVVRHLLS